jgi:precorrin-2 dehydrogenase / sirohydrochlorin ferrochelatase
MKLFPAFLDLAARSCLVVGGGRVGLEKAKSLVAAGASVVVIDPEPSSELLSEARVTVEARAYRPGDCCGRFLVFACTGRPAVDADVAAAAKAAGALCCRADGVPADFTTGAVLRRGELCFAVSSGGASPVLAAEARDRAAEAIGPEFDEAARLLGGLRARLRARGAAPSETMGGVLVRELLAALRAGDSAQAEAFVEKAFASSRGIDESGEGSCTR